MRAANTTSGVLAGVGGRVHLETRLHHAPCTLLRQVDHRRRLVSDGLFHALVFFAVSPAVLFADLRRRPTEWTRLDRECYWCRRISAVRRLIRTS